MGCGCGRKKTRISRADRIKKRIIKISKVKKANIKAASKAVVSPLTSKSSICLLCAESKQSKEEKRKGIRVCRKSNRLINNIIRDPRFICPLGKWN